MGSSRQLAAILFADIEGFTTLMEEDESSALTIRNRFYETLDRECKTHDGSVVQQTGDGALCIFKSSIEAVRAAIDVQLQMQTEPRIPLRIGLHSGDIISEGGSIYGDGVNVASRIESFAIAGGVFISGKVFDDIKNQRDIPAVSVGRYQLKNVKVPVEILAISCPGLAVPGHEHFSGKGFRVEKKGPLSKSAWFSLLGLLVLTAVLLILQWKNGWIRTDPAQDMSLAVLPFINLSASEDDAYFTAGMCDEILTQISKISELNVMSRTSTIQYKDSKKSIRQISGELGADFLLEGTVQKAGNRVRINAQLVDARNDKHLWAESYDRDLSNVFAIQTDIARQIAVALDARLTEKEERLFDIKPTENLEAYDFYLRGNNAFAQFWDYGLTDQGLRAARMYEQAIKRDPEFSAAYCALIRYFASISWINGDASDQKARDWLKRLTALDKNDAFTHYALAIYRGSVEKDYDVALRELALVDELTGNSKSTYELRADMLRSMGRIDESLYYLKKQAALFPKGPRYLASIAETFKLDRNFDSALHYIDQAIRINPDVAGLYMRKSMYYAELNGDVAAALTILTEAAPLVDTSEFRSDRAYFESLKGHYDQAMQLTVSGVDSLGKLWQWKFLPNSLSIAIMYHVQGKRTDSRIYFQKAYETAARLSSRYPDDFRFHAAMGTALAGLGNHRIAITEGKRAIELMPVSKDAIIGVSPLESMALIYTLLGEEEQAIDLLQQMLQMPFAWTMSNTVALYKMHYFWKPLQQNPRFQKMVTDVTQGAWFSDRDHPAV